MKNNGSKKFKERAGFLILVFLVMLSKIFFESFETGLTKPVQIGLAIATGIAFAAFIITAVGDDVLSRFSVQSILVVITLIFTLGAIISKMFISDYIMFSVLLTSLMILFSRRFSFLPFATVMSVAFTFLDTAPEIQSAAFCGIPVGIGVSGVYLYKELKGSAVWKKILVALQQIIMIAAVSKVYYTFRYTLTIHSLITQVWDSIPSLVAIIILVALAVCAIIKKRGIGEVLGYAAVAALGIPPMFMDVKYVLVSAMAMFMMLTACSYEGSTADIIFAKPLDSVVSKIKKLP